MNALRAYWYGLSQREKQMVSAAGVVVVVFFAYMMLWKPLQTNLHRKQRQVVTLRANVAEMQSLAEQLKPTSGDILAKSQIAIDPNLFNAVQKMLPRLNAKVIQFEANGNLKAQLQMESVAFDELMYWLMDLSSEQQIQVSRLQASSQSPGLVNLQMELIRKE